MTSPGLVYLLLASLALSDSVRGLDIPDNLVPRIIAAMKHYETTQTCDSYMNIIKKVSKMEKILCSTGNEKLCDGAKAVAKFFTKVLFEKLPQCLRGLISRTRNKNMHGVGW